MFNFTTKNIGFTLLGLISFAIIGIIINAIRIINLKRKLKQVVKLNLEQSVKNINHLSNSRRTFKNGKSHAYYFDKDLIKKFKAKFGRKANISLNLEKLIIDFLEKGNKVNV